jgi:hypothetical protein
MSSPICAACSIPAVVVTGCRRQTGIPCPDLRVENGDRHHFLHELPCVNALNKDGFKHEAKPYGVTEAPGQANLFLPSRP